MRGNFELAVDTFAIFNSLPATYSFGQMDEKWIPQVENKQHRKIQNELLL